MKRPHIPVMLDEVLEGFRGAHLNIFFDGTVGAFGHGEKILEEHLEIKQYIGCDRDKEALHETEGQLGRWREKVSLVESNFLHLDEVLKEKGIDQVDGFFLT